MTDNKPIFDCLRPWLDADGFNKPGRTAALDAAISAFMLNGDHGPVFETVRPWLDREGYTTRRINALDAALEALRGAASVQSPGWGGDAAPAPVDASTGKKADRIADFIGGFISTHEGGLSMDPKDNGNWTGGHQGRGNLVGSKYGVTAGAVAMYRGVPVASITKADIANLTREEAVAIGVKNYYRGPGFDKLPWNRVTLSIIDKGWGSGPGRAIKLLKRMLGLPETTSLDQATIDAYAAYIARVGEEAAARKWADVRIAFDTSLGQPRFINGWNNRTRSFLPGTAWWSAWA